jgi:nucleoside-diphosphate-sugar epimerase
MRVVALTGSSGDLGRRVLRALERREGVRRVIGIDVREPRMGSGALEHYNIDVRDPSLHEVLAGADCVIHLATITSEPQDAPDIAAGGTTNVLESAQLAGAGHAVVLSSGLVYGAHPDNDVPLREGSPLRPMRDVSESSLAGAVEAAVDDARKTSQARIAVLRPAQVAGAEPSAAVSMIARVPVLPMVRGHRPALQFLDVEDLAGAVEFAARSELDGAFNVAPPGALDLGRIASILGRRTVTLARADAERVAWAADRLARERTGLLRLLMHSVELDASSLESAGFAPSRSNEEALAASSRAVRERAAGNRMRAGGVAALAASGAVFAMLVVREVRRQLARRAV